SLGTIRLRAHNRTELSPDVSLLGARWNVRDKPLRMMRRRPRERVGLVPTRFPLGRIHRRHRGQTGSGSEEHHAVAKQTGQTSPSILEPGHRKSSPFFEEAASLSVPDTV